MEEGLHHTLILTSVCSVSKHYHCIAILHTECNVAASKDKEKERPLKWKGSLLQSLMLMNSSLRHLIDHMIMVVKECNICRNMNFVIVKTKSAIIQHHPNTWCLKMSSCICIVFLMDSTLFLSSILSMGPCSFLISVL